MTEQKKNNSTSDELFSNIKDRAISEEMEASYIKYSMSVIVGRALPDVRDGLKPVHRRVLYAMNEMGLKHNKAHKKSARVVGDVLGKYHPHGDTAVYDSLVRMAQPFSLRYTLADGQGNFGSVDGDSAAAMRYTEIRMSGVAEEMMGDIEKKTVKFIPNYDGSLSEPTVLPAKFPCLLTNGSSGIAVGMATNIPTHNLSEVCDLTMALIDNPDMEIRDIMKIMKGPDFPTGGIIKGKKGIKDYFETGRGSIKTYAKTDIEDIKGNKQAIVVTEIPYQVNKTNLINSIVDLVRSKKIVDISDIRDESDRRGMRLVIEVKRDGNAQVVLNQLFKHTQLKTSFGVIMLAIVEGRPKVLSIKEVVHHFLKHRKEVIVNRVKFDLKKAQRRAHILEGFLIAIKNMDEVVAIIRKSKDAAEAKVKLISKFSFTDIQAQAVLDMRLHQLTRLESGQIQEEHKALLKLIAELQGILKDPKKVLKIIIDELGEIKKKYGDKRRSEITIEATELAIEDLIPEENVVITLSHGGYIKRIPVDTYKVQGRGGKGIIGSDVKDADFIERLFVTSSHATIMFFTSRGKIYSLKGYEIPEGNRTSRGKAIVNLLQTVKDEKITSVIAIESFDEAKGKETYLVMCTKTGRIKKTPIGAFANIRRTGIAAITLEDGDLLTSVGHTDGKHEIIMGTQNGMSIRFPESNVRSMGRTARGVTGMKLAKGDTIVGMEVAEPETKKRLLTVCENGYGKKTKLDEYRNQRRGGRGVITIKASARNGKGVGIYLVLDKDDLIFMTEKGKIIRMSCKSLRVISRNTQGVRLVRLQDGDKVASVETIIDEDVSPVKQIKDNKLL